MISIPEVEKVAGLAKLRLTAEEKQRMAQQLQKVVEYVEKINELDTRDVEPSSHSVDTPPVLREDRAAPWLSQEEALQNAPAKRSGYFSVPKVIG